jgi:hypothetical protein
LPAVPATTRAQQSAAKVGPNDETFFFHIAQTKTGISVILTVTRS